MSDPAKTGNFREGLESGTGNRPRCGGSTDDDRRVVEPDALGQVGGEECGVDGSSALDEQPGDGETSQFLHHPGKIDPSIPFGCDPDLGAFAQLAHPFPGRGFSHHNPGPGLKGVVQKTGFERGAGMGVEHDTPGRKFPVSESDGQSWVVGQDGADADEDGVMGAAESHDIQPGSRAGDPSGLTGAGGDLAVEGETGLEGDERGVVKDPMIEPDIQFGGGFGEETGLDADPGLAKKIESATGMGGVGIRGGNHDPVDAGGDDGLGAGRSASVGGAGFEGDVEGGPAKVMPPGPGIPDGFDLGVRQSGPMMPAVAEALPVADEHCADHGVGAGLAHAPAGQSEGTPHPVKIDGLMETVLRNGMGWGVAIHGS